MKIVSMNIRGVSREKVTAIFDWSPGADIYLFQEVQSLGPLPGMDGYEVHANPGKYAGTCAYVRDSMDVHCVTLVEGRVQALIFGPGAALLNVYHLRVRDRGDIGPRVAYDIDFLRIFEDFVFGRKIGCVVILGDFNSVRRFHDSQKNAGTPEDPGRAYPEMSWAPGIPTDPSRGSYERQFMNYFVRRYSLGDAGDGKGMTFYKRGRPCMRIDYCLTGGVAVASYMLEYMGGVSDHVAMRVDVEVPQRQFGWSPARAASQSRDRDRDRDPSRHGDPGVPHELVDHELRPGVERSPGDHGHPLRSVDVRR